MNDRFLSLLGMARRAGKLSLGHDGVKDCVRNGSAVLVIISSDASERLKNEFVRLCGAHGGKASVLLTDYTMQTVSRAVGSKTGTVSVNDDGFALSLKRLYEEEHKEDRLC